VSRGGSILASGEAGDVDFTVLATLLGAPERAAHDRPVPRRRRALEARVRDVDLAERFAGLTYAFDATPSTPAVDPLTYDHVIVGFSGGKDSMALVLLLLLLGVPQGRIELWHHEVDGNEGSTLMDWPCTRDYCQRVAKALGLRLFRSWKVGGFEGEMTKEDAPTAGYRFEVPGAGVESAGGKSNRRGTRLVFPQKAADLTTRWCSAYLKIMVMEAALRNQLRFHGKRTLVLTGERYEESTNRQTYDVVGPHRTDLRRGRWPRLVDHWRPLHRWPEAEVWKLLERFRINAHPAYWLGWGRVSCAPCIFGSPDQWASLREVNPVQFAAVADYERRFGKTIDRHRSVPAMADKGTPFAGMDPRHVRAALSREFTEPVFLDPWRLPRGALLGDTTGPT
jgi:3'-phosphoadenosine 5'-phosphosulfate sulfotransferase (PAPS reductase)/FAD synthetase